MGVGRGRKHLQRIPWISKIPTRDRIRLSYWHVSIKKRPPRIRYSAKKGKAIPKELGYANFVSLRLFLAKSAPLNSCCCNSQQFWYINEANESFSVGLSYKPRLHAHVNKRALPVGGTAKAWKLSTLAPSLSSTAIALTFPYSVQLFIFHSINIFFHQGSGIDVVDNVSPRDGRSSPLDALMKARKSSTPVPGDRLDEVRHSSFIFGFQPFPLLWVFASRW